MLTIHFILFFKGDYMIHKKILTTLACGAALLAFAGCSDKAATDAANSAASSIAAAVGTKNEAEVYNAYIKAHNDITGKLMFHGQYEGIESLLKAYKKQNLSSEKINVKKADPDIYLNTSLVNHMISNLKEAQNTKLGGDYQHLESIGAKLLVTASQLYKQGTELEDYFESKKYMEDNLAKAKAENDAFVKQWEKFNAEFNEFSAELDKLEAVRLEKEIVQYEKRGMLREANSTRALASANKILNMINSTDDLKNKQKVAAVDAEIKIMEDALAKLKEENAKATDSDAHEFSSRYDYLNSFVGEWRSFKASKKARNFNRMVDKYNSAVR